ncbi:hypothetical protein EI427_23715 [Flammeovirga pectinis]|uniref:Porin n=1 Tax=Flammeovirga pectinis TaxID=2494373 RepID=A0A3S9PAF4_9BACT|nr:hypothetical protein [Flammeovirga pectinis]AZQ65225.1 hypothetical protein EI427_23715 [Flammeovirga pectinis]
MKKNIILLFALVLLVIANVNAQDQSLSTKDSTNIKESNYWQFFKKNLSLTVDARMDFTHLGYQDDMNGVYNSDQRFQFSDFRIGMSGMLNKNFGFNFLYSPNASDIGEDNISDDILYANFTYLSDNGHWFFQAGKGFLNVGTAEQYYDPNDVYTYSIIGNNLGVYKTGVTVQYNTTSGQSFGAQVVNGNADSLGNQMNMEYNLYWYGFIVKDKINTFASATTIDDKSNLSTGTPYVVNLGLQWTLGDFIIDTDYAIAENMPNFYDNALYQSAPIKVMYNGKKFRPYIKYIYNNVNFNDPNYQITLDDGTVQDVENANVHTLEVALQYYPIEGKNIRLHLVGSYTTDANIMYGTPENNYPDSRQHYNAQFQVMAGIRVGFDALKGW